MTRSPLLSAMMGLLLRIEGSGTLPICYSFANPMALQIDVMRISPARGEPLALPSYATEGAAGIDLRADVAVTLGPGEPALVPTGLAIAIPPGFEGQVRPRSGLALREGVTCLNSPGTIDSDYRGEVAVI